MIRDIMSDYVLLLSFLVKCSRFQNDMLLEKLGNLEKTMLLSTLNMATLPNMFTSTYPKKIVTYNFTKHLQHDDMSQLVTIPESLLDGTSETSLNSNCRIEEPFQFPLTSQTNLFVSYWSFLVHQIVVPEPLNFEIDY